MIKETKVLKEDIKRQRFCDECGEELHWGLACCKAQCLYCGKDLCDKCVGHEEDTWGDYRVVYCKSCWDKGKIFRPLIEQHENEVHKLYEEWQKSCSHDKS